MSTPRVTVTGRGRVNFMLDTLAEMYEKNNPGRKARWIYSPLHRPELSSVLRRKAQGWRDVEGYELGDDVPGFKSNEIVRVGDLVLMSIEEESLKEIQEELKQRAIEASKMLDREYYESLTRTTVGKSGEVYRATPKGGVSINDIEFEYERHQREE